MTKGHRHFRHGHKLALKRHHHHPDLGERPVEWEGLPSLFTVFVTFGIALVVIAAATTVVMQNCTFFGICSNYVRDAPHTFEP